MEYLQSWSFFLRDQVGDKSLGAVCAVSGLAAFLAATVILVRNVTIVKRAGINKYGLTAFAMRTYIFVMANTSFAYWRSSVGLTQAQAAQALGVALTTVKQYEIGRHLSTGKAMSPPEPVRRLMRAIANGIRLEPWPE